MEWAADLIWLLHTAFIIWYFLVPFFNNHPMLVLHLFTGPLLFLHWLLNSDDCSLTLLEMKLRGIEDCKESFFWNLVSPIYKPPSDDVTRQLIWAVSIFLWGITVIKVVHTPSILTSVFKDTVRAFRGQPPLHVSGYNTLKDSDTQV